MMAVCDFRLGNHGAIQRLFEELGSDRLSADNEAILLRHQFIEFIKLGQFVEAIRLLEASKLRDGSTDCLLLLTNASVQIRTAGKAATRIDRRAGTLTSPRNIRFEQLCEAEKTCKRINKLNQSRSGTMAELVAIANNYLQLVIELAYGGKGNRVGERMFREMLKQADPILGKSLPKRPFGGVLYRPSI